MDLSDLAAAEPAPERRLADPRDAAALLAQLGSEVAGLLADAAKRVAELAATRRISRSSLRALRDEIDRARRAAITGQQVSRLAGGDLPLADEALALHTLLHAAVRQRAREIEIRGARLRLQLAPAGVRSDATLLFALLRAVLDWSFEHSCSRIELTLAVAGWPARARLHCAFGHRPPDEVVTVAPGLGECPEPALDTLSWRLLQRMAATLDVELWRRDGHGRTELTLEFVHTLAPSLPVLEPPAGSVAPVDSTHPPAGCRVLVLAPRRETRNLVREALRAFVRGGLQLDFAADADEARELRRAGPPQVLIHEAGIDEASLQALRGPDGGAICIVDHGHALDLAGGGSGPLLSVGRAALVDALPAALLFELERRAPAAAD